MSMRKRLRERNKRRQQALIDKLDRELPISEIEQSFEQTATGTLTVNDTVTITASDTDKLPEPEELQEDDAKEPEFIERAANEVVDPKEQQEIATMFCEQYGWPEPVLVPGTEHIWITQAEIGPDDAAELLGEYHIERNRNRRNTRLKSYRTDMQNGWTLTHQGLAINTEGEVFDGQHRLYACMTSETGVLRTMVTFGLPLRAMRNFDTNVPRTHGDNFHLQGQDITHREIAVAKGMLTSQQRSDFVPTQDELDEFIFDFLAPEGNFIWACQQMGHVKNLCNASTIAAVGNAAYYYSSPEQRTRLEQFCTVYRTGLAMDGEDDLAAVVLRQRVTEQGGMRSNATRKELFNRTQTAIRMFMERHPAKRSSDSGVLWPYPHPDNVPPRYEGLVRSLNEEAAEMRKRKRVK
jgi:hypothetical protein